MGKLDLQRQQEQEDLQRAIDERANSSSFLCQTYSVGFRRVANGFSFKCVFVLLLSLSVFLSALFWILPSSHSAGSGFDADEQIKRCATVQAYFRLEKPVSLLIPHIERLEYDIAGEVGVPHTKVAILSIKEFRSINHTHIIFGVLSDQITSPIDPVSLSVLRASLVELFLRQSNLTLTTAIFGQPSSMPSLFEILKFPEGITVIPAQSGSAWQIRQVLFDFGLNNSVSEVQENLVELKEQLKIGLHLRSYEIVYVQVTNEDGSTVDPPVTVKASVLSDSGRLLPQRLKQLAQTITRSPPARNLGLNHTVFGKVKGVSLSSYMKHTLHTGSPTPAPSPSPYRKAYPPPHHMPPIYRIAPSPHRKYYPSCTKCHSSSPSPTTKPGHSLSPDNAPAPSVIIAHPPHPCIPHGSSSSRYTYGFHPCPSFRYSSPPTSLPAPHASPGTPSVSHSPSTTPHLSPRPVSSRVPPSLPPLPMESYGSRSGPEQGKGKGSVSPSLAPTPSSRLQTSFAVAAVYQKVWIVLLSFLLIFNILC